MDSVKKNAKAVFPYEEALAKQKSILKETNWQPLFGLTNMP